MYRVFPKLLLCLVFFAFSVQAMQREGISNPSLAQDQQEKQIKLIAHDGKEIEFPYKYISQSKVLHNSCNDCNDASYPMPEQFAITDLKLLQPFFQKSARVDENKTLEWDLDHDLMDNYTDQELYTLANLADYLDMPLLLDSVCTIIAVKLKKPEKIIELFNTGSYKLPLPDEIKTVIAQKILSNKTKIHWLLRSKIDNKESAYCEKLSDNSNVIAGDFNSKGDKLVTLSIDKTTLVVTIRLWDLSIKKCIHEYIIPQLNLIFPFIRFDDFDKHVFLFQISNLPAYFLQYNCDKLFFNLDLQKITQTDPINKDVYFEFIRKKFNNNYIFILNSNHNSFHIGSENVLQFQCNHKAKIKSVEFNKSGSLIISASSDKSVCIWDSQTGKCIEKLEHPGAVKYATISQHDDKIFSACQNKLFIWHNYNPELKTWIDKKILPEQAALLEMIFNNYEYWQNSNLPGLLLINSTLPDQLKKLINLCIYPDKSSFVNGKKYNLPEPIEDQLDLDRDREFNDPNILNLEAISDEEKDSESNCVIQ
jgi:hypothetical protein